MQATGIWAQLQRAKTLVCEPHGTGEAFDNAMKTYYDAIAEGRGAIFFAICRGKVSTAEAVKPYTTALSSCRCRPQTLPNMSAVHMLIVGSEPGLCWCPNVRSPLDKIAIGQGRWQPEVC